MIEVNDGTWLDAAPVRERAGALEAAGFAPVGLFRSDAFPNSLISGFVHSVNRIFAQITKSKERVSLVLMTYYVDSRYFLLSDGPDKPAMPKLPWRLGQGRPDLSAHDLILTFCTLRPAGDAHPATRENFISLEEESFQRTQAWRAERGGWTLAEISAQKGLPESTEPTEELRMLRHDSAEIWLFNWLKLQSNLPFAPQEALEDLVIIHDDLTPDLLANSWWVSTNDFQVKEAQFTEGTARVAFRRVNAERGCKLRLVLQKSSHLPADFYLP